MYALIKSTNRRNKEPKKNHDQERTKKQLQRNKTKPGAKKIIKHRTQKITIGGETVGSAVGRLLCSDLVRVWLIAWFFIHHCVPVSGSSVCDLVIACVWCSCVILFSGLGVSRTGGIACLPHF